VQTPGASPLSPAGTSNDTEGLFDSARSVADDIARLFLGPEAGGSGVAGFPRRLPRTEFVWVGAGVAHDRRHRSPRERWRALVLRVRTVVALMPSTAGKHSSHEE
jgi:hypothetical protein